MFTGIVDAVGRVAKATRETGNGKRAEGLALTIQSRYRGVKKGESIAVNGACLTVEKVLKGSFTGVGTVERVTEQGDAALIDIRVPPEVRETTVLHGAITVDGVSLTVNALPGDEVIQLSLVPFTREHTTLGRIAVGDRVHIEADVLGKYVRQLCRSGQ